MLFAICHSEGEGWSKVGDLSTLSELRDRPGNLIWAEIDVADLDEGDVDLIAEEFDLHELAVEDAVKERQRPKVERFGDHVFVVLHQLDEIDRQLEAIQISAFIGPRYMLVFHLGANRTLEE